VPPKDEIRAALDQCRKAFVATFVFGFFINLLMLSVSIYSMQVFDRVLGSGSLDTLLMLTLVVGIALIFMGAFQWLRSLVLSHVAHWFEEQLAPGIAGKTLEISLLKPTIGAQPVRDLATVKGFINSPSLCAAFDAPWAIVYFIVLYIINMTLGLVVTGAALLMVILNLVSERLPKERMSRAHEAQLAASQALDAVLRNAEIIKAMGFQRQALAKWREATTTGASESFAIANLSNVLGTITRNFRLAIQTGLTGVAAWLVIRGDMSSGAIIAASMLAGKALQPFDAFLPIYQGWTSAKKAYERLSEVIKTADQLDTDQVQLPEPMGRITLDKITYQEKTSGRWILRGINVEFPAGEAIGIIGPSGSGKTTLARLIMGVLRPTSGSVRLDGADITQWHHSLLGRYLGYLPQDVELFEGSVAENIARLDQSYGDEEIIGAAKISQGHDYILQFPGGYQTEVGRYGAFLSAGQRQRVALARCFIGPVRVVVLDEPNSNLDTEGELAFVETLLEAKRRGITTISIVHRPAVLQKVDKILVLHNGEAKMFGPAKEVLDKLTNTGPNVQPIRKTRGNDARGGDDGGE
jgi:PrtD family type I secretion system ABC transporter